ncbi:MAG: sulfatase family protein [Verrucomicrobiota bacterium]
MPQKFSSAARHFYLSIRLLAAALLTLCFPVASRVWAAESRPNFLVMVTDDQQWAALSCVQRELGAAGRFPWFQTPNLDRLAAEGVRFRNAFVTESLCSPSRAAILTGQYNHLNGVVNNHTFFPMTNVTYSALMRDAGYETAFFGKFHHGTQPGPRPGFELNYTFIGQGQYFDCPFEINGKLTPTKGWVDDVTTGYVLDYLKQKRDKPFSMIIGFKTPHEPWQPPERTQNLYTGELGGFVPNLTTLPIYRQSRADLQYQTWAENAIREGRPGVKMNLNYFRCIKAMDDDVGQILNTLDELNLATNTVVVFTSDNGVYLGAHCLHDKRSVYDDSLRVPMLLRYPKLIPPGQVRDELVLNIDIAPTLLDLASLPVPAQTQGRSWRPLLAGEPADWRKSFLAEYFIESTYPNTPNIVALCAANAKLSMYPGHEEWTELFDLKNDPYETNNLAKDPEHARMLAEMKAEFSRQARAVNYCVPDYADKVAFNPDYPEQKAKAKN